MNRTARLIRLDILMLAIGLSIALASTYAKADTVTEASPAQLQMLTLARQAAAQNPKLVSVPMASSAEARASHTVQLSSDGGATQLQFVPAPLTNGVTTGMKVGPIAQPAHAELFF